MAHIVFVEIAADSPERALRFYSDVFGWSSYRSPLGKKEYWELQTSDDDRQINVGLHRREGNEGHVVTIGVDSIDETLARVTAAGGTIAVPKQIVAGIGAIAYCTDTEGTMFGLWCNLDDEE